MRWVDGTIPCPDCGGDGSPRGDWAYIERTPNISYFRCPSCKGSGRSEPTHKPRGQMNLLRRLLHHIDPTGGCQRCGLRWTQKAVDKGLMPSVCYSPRWVKNIHEIHTSMRTMAQLLGTVDSVPAHTPGAGYKEGVHALCANCMAELPRQEWLPYFEKQCREQHKREMWPELREAILHGSDIG